MFMLKSTHKAAMAENDKLIIDLYESLSNERGGVDELTAENTRLRRELATADENARIFEGLANTFKDERDAARAALREIVAMETPSCAHIGKRMAGIARDHLGLNAKPRIAVTKAAGNGIAANAGVN